MFGKSHAQWRRGLRLALTLQGQSNGIGVGDTAIDGIRNGRSHLRTPMHIKHLLQLLSGTPQRFPAFGGLAQQGLYLRNCVY
jgi:hypothetical protein